MMLTFPAILIALLINGVARSILPREVRQEAAIFVFILAIGSHLGSICSNCTRSDDGREKQGIRVGRPAYWPAPLSIMANHVLPNVMGPVLVIATINLAMAVLIEATLSFLGVGMPPTQPSLGTLIRIGNEYLVFRDLVGCDISVYLSGVPGIVGQLVGGLVA